ncbi:hypothetical protein [Streptomyces sp. NPDC050704]|uniref:hypothetical protein n=1 Tax=Streptomyces sp. NPDC050704 TaxID=3157219 RepID=UPI00342C2CC8
MTTVTLPTVSPHPGRYAVAPGRSFVELSARYGPLPTRRRRLTLAGASLMMPESDDDRPVFRFDFDLGGTTGASLVSDEHGEPLGPLSDGRRLQLTADLVIKGVAFPALLALRVVSCAEDRLLVVVSARLPYRLLSRATGFRLPRPVPATELRLLLAGEFA